MKIDRLIARRWVIGLSGVVLLGALAFVALRSGPMAPTRVTVIQVSQGSFAPALFGIGIVQARRAYFVGPTSPGRVRKVSVDVGDSVKAGQLLAEMDPVDLDERASALDASIARAGSAVTAMNAQHQDALARREIAIANAKRYAHLGGQGFISAGGVETKLQERTSADAAVTGAQANIAAARQDLQRLGAERMAIKVQRDNLRLLAPGDGVVVARDAEPGSTVVAGQAVLRMIEPSSLWITVRLDQGRSTGLAAGLPAQIVLRSNPAVPLSGRIARVESLSDSVTEERIAQVVFDRLPPALTMGELAEVTLGLPKTATAVVVPNASLRRLDGRVGVWIVDDGALHFAPVHVGQTSLDGQVQILQGLEPGQRIVVYSEKDLTAASRIKVVDRLMDAQP